MSTSVLEPVATKPLTYEEEWGKLLPSRNHGRVQTNIIVELAQHTRWSVYSELTLLVDGRKFTPDLSVYPQEPADFRHDEAARTDLPSVTVEILSASQTVDFVGRASGALSPPRREELLDCLSCPPHRQPSPAGRT